MSTLGLDTSNYTTSAAKYDGSRVTDNRRRLLPVPEGAKGLRQSDAVFHHTRQLPDIASPLLPDPELSAIGVSVSPTGAEGSYMPCFLTGKGMAAVLGAALNVPVYEFSHQQGHIAAALYSGGRLELLEEKFLAFHVSGGTTEALLVSPGGSRGPKAVAVAGSLDLKAGQAVDRVGLALGLKFPCGPELEKLALACPGEMKIRPVMRGADCSLSGIENRCLDMIKKGHPKEEVARYCLEYITSELEGMCSALLSEYGELPVVFSGGVCSDSILRDRLTERFGAVFSEPEFSADNAAGIAILAYISHRCFAGRSA